MSEKNTRESIEARIDKSGSCWRWPTPAGERGLAMVLYDGGAWLVQRLLYTWSFGPIPKSVRLRRTCGTPWCVRPDHARLYSAARNVNDMEMREWVLTDARCPAGHRKAEHGRRDRSRRLYCAECLRIKSRRYR